MRKIFKLFSWLGLCVILSSGFVTALIKVLGVIAPVSPQTLAIVVIAPAFLFLSFKLGNFRLTDLYLSLAVSVFIFTKFLWALWLGSPIAYGGYLWYSIFIILFVALHKKNPLSLVEVTNCFFLFGILTGVIAVAQFYGGQYLSPYLIEPPFIKEDLLKTDYAYHLSIGSRIRPNGLFSNPIVYAGFMVVVFEIGLIKLRGKLSYLNILLTILIVFVIGISLSRVAIFGSVVVLLAHIFKWKGTSFLFALIFLVVFTYAVIGKNLFGASEVVTLITERFSGSNKFAFESNWIHLESKLAALKNISDAPFIGFPIGYYATEKIIADGAVFILSLEFGVPITLLLFTLVFKRVRRLANNPSSKLYFPTYSVYFLLISSVINSAVLDRNIVPLLIFLLTTQSARPTADKRRPQKNKVVYV